jgi:hypothetical protein
MNKSKRWWLVGMAAMQWSCTMMDGSQFIESCREAPAAGAMYADNLDSPEGKEMYYGLGIGYSYSREKGLVLEHDGANPGTQSLVRYGREGRITMALMGNLGLYSDNTFFALGDEVMEILSAAVTGRACP